MYLHHLIFPFVAIFFLLYLRNLHFLSSSVPPSFSSFRILPASFPDPMVRLSFPQSVLIARRVMVLASVAVKPPGR